VLEKVCHDNKRGYISERDGFCPFILCKRIGEMHAPNEFYLEYVPVELVREAIIYVVTRMSKIAPKAVASIADDTIEVPKRPRRVSSPETVTDIILSNFQSCK